MTNEESLTIHATPEDSLADLLASVPSGTTVVLAPGNYELTSPLRIEQDNLLLTAETSSLNGGGSEVNILGVANIRKDPLVHVVGQDVTVQNLCFEYAVATTSEQGKEEDSNVATSVANGTTSLLNACIQIGQNSNAWFKGCRIASPRAKAFNICEAAKAKITDCTVTRSTISVAIQDDAAPIVEGCNLGDEKTASGIEVGGRGHPTVRKNTITGCAGSGIVVRQNGTGLFVGNKVERCQLAAVVLLDQADPHMIGNALTGGLCNGVDCFGHSSGIFEDNAITMNAGAGIKLNAFCKPLAEGNRVTGNAYGVWVREEARGTLQNNSIDENTSVGLLVSDLAEPVVAGNSLRRNGHSGLVVQHFAGGEYARNSICDNATNAQVLDTAAPLLEDNAILGGRFGGVLFHNAAAGTLRGNRIARNAVNVLLLHKANPSVVENRIECAVGRGVHVSGSATGFIARNKVVRNGSTGITADGDSAPLVSQNLVLENAACGITLGRNAKGRVEGNVLVSNPCCVLATEGVLVSDNVTVDGLGLGGPGEQDSEEGDARGEAGEESDRKRKRGRSLGGESEGVMGEATIVMITNPHKGWSCGLALEKNVASTWLHAAASSA